MSNDNKGDDELSKLYHSSEKPEPSKELDRKILAAAKSKLDEKTIVNKKNTRSWWLNGRFHGAIAASILLVCLVYILPANYLGEPNTIMDSPQRVRNNTVVPDNQTMITQKQNIEAAHSKKQMAKRSQSPQMVASQSAFKELVEADELANNLQNQGDRMAERAMQTQEMLLTDRSKKTKQVPRHLEEQSYVEINSKLEKIYAQLLQIQETTNLDHQQLIQKISAPGKDQNRPLLEKYSLLHQTLIENLKIVSQNFPEKLTIEEYQKALSEQESIALLDEINN